MSTNGEEPNWDQVRRNIPTPLSEIRAKIGATALPTGTATPEEGPPMTHQQPSVASYISGLAVRRRAPKP